MYRNRPFESATLSRGFRSGVAGRRVLLVQVCLWRRASVSRGSLSAPILELGRRDALGPYPGSCFGSAAPEKAPVESGRSRGSVSWSNVRSRPPAVGRRCGR